MSDPMPTRFRDLVRQALARLGIRRLLLGIHDAAFPSRAGEDLGRGSPYSAGAGDLLELAHRLGFDAVQLGPQGVTSPGNPSPYDGAFFSRNPLSVDMAELAREEWGRLLAPERLAEAVAARAGAGTPGTVDHVAAFPAVERLLALVASALRARVVTGGGGETTRLSAERDGARVGAQESPACASEGPRL